MKYSINVCGLVEVPAYSQAGITDIVSIDSPGSPMPDLTAYITTPSIYRIEFDDTDGLREGEALTVPSHDHVTALIKVFDQFISSHQSRNILFHCRMGRARSAAAAFIFLVYLGYSFNDAFAHVAQVRGAISPNIAMVRHADAVLKLNGEMLIFVANITGAQAYAEKHLPSLRLL